jgi:hypothetical protein
MGLLTYVSTVVHYHDHCVVTNALGSGLSLIMNCEVFVIISLPCVLFPTSFLSLQS